MIEALLIVLTNAVAGRDDDFNDWYTNIHTRDALRFRGSTAQQRFQFSEEQVQDFPQGFVAKYLALYEVYDAHRFSQEHVDNARTPRMEVEDSIDTTRLDDFHYYPLLFRDKAPRTFQTGSVVLEQFKVKEGQEANFREWYSDSYFPERFRQPGIITGSLLTFDSYGQMMPFSPTHDHVAIWRLSNDGARNLWRQSRLLQECPFIEQQALAVSCWDIQTLRVTEDDVYHTSAAALANEEAARKRIHAQGTLLTNASTRIRS